MTTSFTRPKVESLSVANMGDGALAAQVDAALEDIARRIHEHVDAGEGGLYATKDGCLEFQIKPVITIRHDPERRLTEVTVGTETKFPALKSVRRTLLLRSDGFLMERDDTQLAFPTRRRDDGNAH
jgi:hypothetical protein